MQGRFISHACKSTSPSDHNFFMSTESSRSKYASSARTWNSPSSSIASNPRTLLCRAARNICGRAMTAIGRLFSRNVSLAEAVLLLFSELPSTSMSSLSTGYLLMNVILSCSVSKEGNPRLPRIHRSGPIISRSQEVQLSHISFIP